MSEIIIDLDRQAPSASSGESRPPTHYPHWIKLAPVVLLCLALLGQAGLPAPEPVRLLAIVSESAEAFILHHGMIIFPQQPLGLTAFSADGVKRWELAPDKVSSELNPQPVGDLLVISSYRPGPAGDVPYSVALDIHTGQQVWSGEGYASVAGGYFAVIGVDQSIVVYDPATLKSVFALPSQRAVAFGQLPDTVVALSHSGAVSFFQLPAGNLVHPPIPVKLPAGQEVFLNVRSDQVLVDVMQQQQGSGIEAWPVTHVAIDRKSYEVSYNLASDSGVIETPCGPVICRQTFAPDGVITEVASRDGAPAWRIPDGQWVEWLDEGLLLSDGSGAIGLVEPKDGSTRVSLAGWQAVNRGWPGNAPGPLLLARHTGSRLHLAVIGERGLQPLGSIPILPKDCQYEWPFLVCTTHEGQIGVWRLARTR